MASDSTLPIKPGAKLDPKGTAIIKKLKELSKKSQAELGGDSVGHLRIIAQEPSTQRQLQLHVRLQLDAVTARGKPAARAVID